MNKTKGRKKKKGKKRKMNKFFKLMNAAKKSNAKTFDYNGTTYKRAKTSNGLVYYKKA